MSSSWLYTYSLNKMYSRIWRFCSNWTRGIKLVVEKVAISKKLRHLFIPFLSLMYPNEISLINFPFQLICIRSNRRWCCSLNKYLIFVFSQPYWVLFKKAQIFWRKNFKRINRKKFKILIFKKIEKINFQKNENFLSKKIEEKIEKKF